MTKWLKEGIDAGGFAIIIKKKKKKKKEKGKGKEIKEKETQWEQLALTF